MTATAKEERWFRISGNSMDPVLVSGDAVLVRRRPADRLRRGELIAVQRPGAGVVVHRYMGRIRDKDGRLWLAEKGDADGTVGIADPDWLAGRVVRLVRPEAGLVRETVGDVWMRCSRKQRFAGFLWCFYKRLEVRTRPLSRIRAISMAKDFVGRAVFKSSR